MTWRDKYRTASFRGVEFHVESADGTYGRRQAVHEHAQRDVPYTEDLGRKAREFSLTGYVIGVDYDLQREEIIKASEQSGPGLLVHPYRGEMTVVCRGLGVNESSADGGMCRLTFTFLEAGEASFPSTKVDHVNAIGAAGNEVTLAAKQSFLSEYLTTGYPAFVSEAASARVAELGDFLTSSGAMLSENIEAASDFYSSAQGLVSDAYDLVQEPLDMVNRVLGVVGNIRSAFGASAFGVLIDLYDKYSTTFSGRTSTNSRKQEGANYTAMNSLVRQAALAEASQAAVVTESTTTLSNGTTRPAIKPTEYDSYQEAVEIRDALVDRLDAESESTPNDSAYTALTALRTEVVKAVPSSNAELPRLVSYAPRETLPSLLVAYQVYGDATRADEIATRNSPRYPGFLIGGQTLEILADG